MRACLLAAASDDSCRLARAQRARGLLLRSSLSEPCLVWLCAPPRRAVPFALIPLISSPVKMTQNVLTITRERVASTMCALQACACRTPSSQRAPLSFLRTEPNDDPRHRPDASSRPPPH